MHGKGILAQSPLGVVTKRWLYFVWTCGARKWPILKGGKDAEHLRILAESDPCTKRIRLAYSHYWA